MNSAVRHLAFSIFSLLVVCNSTAGAAPFPESRIPYGFRFFNENHYFNTNANYDDKGKSQTLPNGRYYKNYGTNLGAEYWISTNSSLLAELNIAYAESYGSGITRRNSSLTDIWLGWRSVWSRSPIMLVPEVGASYPVNRVSADTNNVLTGEGAMTGEAGFWMFAPLGSFTPFAKAGYFYQDEQRASFIKWQAGFQQGLGPITAFVVAKGNTVAGKDGKAKTPTDRTDITSRVDGGSLKYYSINPEEMSAQAGLFFDIKNSLRVELAFEQTMSGKNSANGYTATVGLQWIMRTKNPNRVRRKRTRKIAPIHEEQVVQPETPVEKPGGNRRKSGKRIQDKPVPPPPAPSVVPMEEKPVTTEEQKYTPPPSSKEAVPSDDAGEPASPTSQKPAVSDSTKSVLPKSAKPKPAPAKPAPKPFSDVPPEALIEKPAPKVIEKPVEESVVEPEPVKPVAKPAPVVQKPKPVAPKAAAPKPKPVPPKPVKKRPTPKPAAPPPADQPKNEPKDTSLEDINKILGL